MENAALGRFERVADDLGDEADEEDEAVDDEAVDAREEVGEDPEGLEEEDPVDVVDVPFVVEEGDEGVEVGADDGGGVAVEFEEVEGDGDAGEGEDEAEGEEDRFADAFSGFGSFDTGVD